MAGGEHDASLLDGRDAGPGPAEIGPAALAHLDEDERLAVAADEVDLAAADSEIAPDFP